MAIGVGGVLRHPDYDTYVALQLMENDEPVNVAQAEVLNLESGAKQVLQETFGYQQFRPGQEEIIDTVLSGRDCLVVMPTGGGKSLCYQIPALLLNGLTVVVSPLISLMKDQVDQLQANGVAAACLNSTQTREQQLEVMTGCRTGQIRLLYIATAAHV